MVANAKALTQGDILDVLLYGDLAHATEAKRAEFESWRSPFPAFAGLAGFHFVGILHEVANFVRYVQALNVELLEADAAAM